MKQTLLAGLALCALAGMAAAGTNAELASK
jgi:hypothetical protein